MYDVKSSPIKEDEEYTEIQTDEILECNLVLGVIICTHWFYTYTLQKKTSGTILANLETSELGRDPI